MDWIRDFESRKGPNSASGFTCPECSGALWEVGQQDFEEFVCRTGHLFSPETLLQEQAGRRDDLLESALRSLREEEALTEQLLERGRERGVHPHRLRRHVRRAAELERVGDDLERMIRSNGPPPDEPPEGRGEGA
jgi:two-component system chemotaxis response regulator CheB